MLLLLQMDGERTLLFHHLPNKKDAHGALPPTRERHYTLQNRI
jgi:hypothetical protein